MAEMLRAGCFDFDSSCSDVLRPYRTQTKERLATQAVVD